MSRVKRTSTTRARWVKILFPIPRSSILEQEQRFDLDIETTTSDSRIHNFSILYSLYVLKQAIMTGLSSRQKKDTGLITLIRQRSWEEVLLMCQQRSDVILTEVMKKGRRLKSNSSPIHLACLYRAPTRVIRIILQIFCINSKEHIFDDKKFNDLLIIQDEQGWTPLHIAILYGVEDDALLLIIQACVQLENDVLLMKNHMGWTPLLLALRYGSSTCIIRALLEADTNSISISNMCGTSPLFMRWYAWEKLQKDTGNTGTSISFHVDDLTKSSTLNGALRRCWEDMMYLLKAASFHQDINTKKREVANKVSKEQINRPFEDMNLWQLFMLHSSIKNGAPIDFIKLVMKMHPEQVERPDWGGNTPLHIAAGTEPFTRCEEYAKLINELVEAFPQAAAKLNTLNRFPLNILLENGATWDNGVESVFRAAPDVVSTRDSSSRMFPFMVSASSKSNCDTVYTLLRSNPSTILQ